MRVTDVLNKDCVMPDLGAQEKRGVLDEMAEGLASRVDGCGVAVPHAKIKGIDAIAVAFGRSKKGVDFHSMDGKPVHLFFLIAAPENSTVVHLKILAGISRLLKDNGFREKLIRASNGEDIYRMIEEEEKRIAKSAVL